MRSDIKPIICPIKAKEELKMISNQTSVFVVKKDLSGIKKGNFNI